MRGPQRDKSQKRSVSSHHLTAPSFPVKLPFDVLFNTMKIALIGDSITERWGPNCPQLVTELSRLFIRTPFEIVNHGLSGSRAGNGLWRVSNDYLDSGGTVRQCLSATSPDIVLVESFAYTNCQDDVEGLTEYRDALRRLIDEIQRGTAAKIMLWVAFGPDRDRFLENAPFYYNTSKITRQRMADRVKIYLEEALDTARDENWPVADVFFELNKKVANGDMARRYINQADGVHPSQLGYDLIARTIVRAIDEHRMIEEGASH